MLERRKEVASVGQRKLMAGRLQASGKLNAFLLFLEGLLVSSVGADCHNITWERWESERR